MAWSWSHTEAAYADARANLENEQYMDLVTAYAEILSHDEDASRVQELHDGSDTVREYLGKLDTYEYELLGL